jgi:hypothetical protein
MWAQVTRHTLGHIVTTLLILSAKKLHTVHLFKSLSDFLYVHSHKQTDLPMLARMRANCAQKNVSIELKAVKARLKNYVMQTTHLKR